MDPFWEGVGLQHRHFSVKMYVKTKESGPVGGMCQHAPYIHLWVAFQSRCNKLLSINAVSVQVNRMCDSLS